MSNLNLNKMKSKRLLLMLLCAFFAPWAAMGQNRTQLNEGFDNNFPPEEWSTIHVSGAKYWEQKTNYYHGGSASAAVQYATNSHENWLVTPQLAPAANEALTFYVSSQTYAGTTLYVMLSTTTPTTDAFTVTLASYTSGNSGTIGSTSLSTFVEKTIPASDLESYVGQPIYIAFRVVDNDGSWIYLDDVSGLSIYVPPYPKPTALIVDEVTDNSATISWTAPTTTNTITGYSYQYKKASESEWSVAQTVTATSAPLSGLSAITEYNFRVKALYEGNNESDWATKTFTTECGPIGIGYQCGFEGPNTVGTGSYKLPTCWSRPDGTSTTYPGATNSYGHNSSTYSLYFYGAATSTLQIAVLPEIDGGVNGKRLALYARNPSTWYDASFVVGYMTDPADASTFVQVGDPISLPSSTPYGNEPYEFDFANITGNPHYMAIKSTSTSSSSYFAIDDVELKATPTCLRPTMNTTATEIAATTAKVEWTAAGENQTHWDVYYCTSPYTAPTASTGPSVTNTADNPCTLTGLSPTTSYRVYVRGNCGDGDVSEWSTNYCQFTTTAYCADMQVQYNTINFTDLAYNTVTVYWTAAGAATNWKVQLCTSTSFTENVIEKDATEATANITGLSANTKYYVRVAPWCEEAHDYTPWSSSTAKYFTTPESCPAPVLAAATNPTAHGATLNWTGSSATYDVMYRTAAYTEGLVEGFGTSTPTGWTNGSGALNTETGTATISSGSYWSFGTNNNVFDNHAYFNMYGSKNNWLITPQIAIGANYPFSFDVAYTSYYDGSPTTGGPHKLFVLISTDEKAHWTILREWNNTGSEYVLDEIDPEGQTVNDISLAAYAGKNAYIAFLGVSSTTNYDNNIHIDNVTIGTGISHEAGDWQPAATGITANTVVLEDDTKFEPETIYDVKLVGYCPWTDEETESNTVQFTTTSSCETPSNLQESEVTANSAKISWDGHGLTAFNLRYGTDGENWTTVENVANPYTLDGVLESNKAYQVQVQATCNTEEWSTVLNFYTECGPISLATEPYQYGFETALEFNCWTVLSGTITRINGIPHNDSYRLDFRGTTDNRIQLPQFDASTNTLRLEFWTRPENCTNSNCGNFSVGYYNSTNEFVAIETYAYNDWSSDVYLKKTIDLVEDANGDAVPADAQIVFRHHNCSAYYYWYVDDVKVKVIPTCEDVDNVAASNVTNHSASIAWTADAAQSAWQIAYKADANFNPFNAEELATATVVDVTTNPYLFDKNLDDETTYYMYVRGNCTASENGYGDWSDTYATFTTAIAAPAPTAFNKTEVGPDWVDLYWTAPAGDRLSGYGIYYSESSDEPEATQAALATINDATAPTSESPYRLEDLENETTYYIWVRANHETGVYSSWVALSGSSITTLVACPVPTDLEASNISYTTADLNWNGYSDEYNVVYRVLTLSDETETSTETFASYTAVTYNATGELPTGWNGYSSGTYKPHVSNNSVLGTSYDITGIGGGEGGTDNFLYMIGNSTSPNSSFTILPQFDNLVAVSFDYAYESTSYGTLSVGYCTNNTSGSTYTAFNDLTITKTTTSANVSLTEADIAAINSNNGYLAFRWNCSSSYGIAIDNVAITTKSYIAGPWSDPALTTNTESITLTNLLAGTKYEVKVQANCGDEYSEIIDFTTLPFTKTIAPYSTNGYYLIASPLAGDANGEIAATDVANLIDNETPDNFALYRFNQDKDLEWENYKANSFNLKSGRGYLYGNSEGVELTFTGVPYSGDGEVTLSNTGGKEFAGWNLVGNPFGETAYILGNDYSFYTMKEGGAELEANYSFASIEPMEGVFVYTDQDGVTLTFTTEAPEGNGDALTLNVSKGRSVIDRAIVNFGQGGKLPKFMLNRNSTKVYIPQDGKDYAVVNAESQGEMPVSFKAEENGTYSMSFTSTEVTFNYLHLIDNMTGTDTDLLQTPSYTFNATMTDYSSRFKLVFAVGSSTDSETFAFYSNGNWIINNEGEATLQVIDVTGRILSSETVNGSVSKAINAAPGVYMIRLINGDNVRTQKVVVR